MFDVNIKKAEYYSLQEACDYLNVKHNTTNTTIDNLLKQIISYETPTYIFAEGFEITGDYVLNSLNSYGIMKKECDNEKKKDEMLQKYKEHSIKITNQIDNYFNTLMDGDGLFLELNNNAICRLPLRGKVNTMDIYEGDLFSSAFALSEISNPTETFNSINKEIKGLFNDYADFILAIYPQISIPLNELDEFDNLDSLKSHYLSKSSLKIIDYYDGGDVGKYNNLTINPYFEITKNDLIILHKDLELLEDKIINNVPVPIKKPTQHKQPTTIRARQGLSKNKALAKAMAVHFADIEWRKDIEKKIKTTEMADIVYKRLVHDGFYDELPKTIEKLKPWFKSVTPTYATESGRPQGS